MEAFAGDAWLWIVAHKWWLMAVSPFVAGYILVKFLNK